MKKRIICLMLTVMLLSGLNAYGIEPVPGISGEDDEPIEKVEESNPDLPEEVKPDFSDSTPSEALPTNPPEELPGEPIPDESLPPSNDIPAFSEPESETENTTENVPPVIGESKDHTEDVANEVTSPEETTIDDTLVVGISESKVEKSIFDANKVECNTSIHGFIDPCNIEGKGQMRFDDIIITNHNDMAVKVILDDFQLNQTGGIILVSEKPTNDTMDKWVMACLTSGDTRTPYFSTETNLYDFGKLEPGETLRLKLDGAVNGCSTKWSENDQINLSFHFEFTPLDR